MIIDIDKKILPCKKCGRDAEYFSYLDMAARRLVIVRSYFCSNIYCDNKVVSLTSQEDARTKWNHANKLKS